ncbi:ABC transporter substrate-binding protein [Nesterenkonia flava]|uniref:ABC transporter substrate-binding protein n=1 Tax=Nesterenkonia flava TaxID=469799 RepID=A0ABU1FX84_9MICC|nr:ABC transporter substrate-binding protein [Nesterenkonia flava]MDR5713085.1 ABC transporter substrate-binding protein [Nesterenkonia flava]
MNTAPRSSLALLAGLTLLLAGCAGGEEQSSEDDLTTVTLGVMTIAPTAAIQYGVDEGIFEEHGLDVEMVPGDGGAAMLPAVQSGEMDFATGNPLSLLVAVGQGLDMRLVSGWSHSLTEGQDINAVVVRADSGIESWRDLEGRSVAVNVLNGQGDLTIMEAVRRDGGDPDAIGLTEVSFPEMEAQLERGNVDAVWLPEPFLSQALAQEEFTLLGQPNQEVLPGLPTSMAFTSGRFYEENPETVAQFKAAMEEAMDAAQNDPEGSAEALSHFLDMPVEAAAEVNMEEFDGDIRREPLEDMSRLMVEYGFIDELPGLDAVIIDWEDLE